jgi:quercetin dioxygenase-like cupin family protein
MRLRGALALLLLLPCIAQGQAAIPVAEEPFHPQLFSNEFVRILNVTIPPGRTSLLHQHDNDYVFVMLRDGSMTSVREDGYSVSLQLNKGDVRFTRGGFAHTAANDGDASLRLLAVELLKGAGAEVCGGQTPPCEKLQADLPVHKVLIDTERVRVSAVHMEPNVGDMHRHDYPHLIIALDSLRLRNEVAGKAPVILQLKAGEYKWLDGDFTHTITNIGKAAVDHVVIEFKEYAATTPAPPSSANPEPVSPPDESEENQQEDAQPEDGE